MDHHSDFSLTRFEAKAATDEVATFAGVASTDDIDLTDDIIEAGAFGKIDARHIALLRDHSASSVIGKWLMFEQDGKQLKVEGEICLSPDVPRGRETYTLMKGGYITGISVGFRILKGGAVWDEANGVRRIKKAKLIEASIVSVPANQRARVRTVKDLLGETPVAQLRAVLAEEGFDDSSIELLAKQAPRRPLVTGIDGFHGDMPPEVRSLVAEMRGFVSQAVRA
jgi:Escherichia/Staphylococcus phage prohead protease